MLGKPFQSPGNSSDRQDPPDVLLFVAQVSTCTCSTGITIGIRLFFVPDQSLTGPEGSLGSL